MTKATYYIENTVDLDATLELLKVEIPCFINREYIEMNYSQVEITARVEDFKTVENLLAPLM